MPRADDPARELYPLGHGLTYPGGLVRQPVG